MQHATQISRTSPRQLARRSAVAQAALFALVAASASALSGCGGGGLPGVPPATAASSAALAAVKAEPLFLRSAAPIVPPATGALPAPPGTPTDAPTDAQAAGLATGQSADGQNGPSSFISGGELASQNGSVQAPAGLATAQAATTFTGYTPAQIRAAYGLSPLPAGAPATWTAAQRAAAGSGQTIYIVDPYNYAAALPDLNTFSAWAGLPTCSQAPAPNGTAALPAANPNACEFVLARVSSAGAPSTAVPAYNAGWAQEAALDLQWAHAIAPLARLVFINPPTNSMYDLCNAALAARRLGPGVVSMSFGATESGAASAQCSPLMLGDGMSYLAATGDWGSQSLTPSNLPSVVGIGGTSLASYASGGVRAESAWTSSGGAFSTVALAPAHQAAFAAKAPTLAGVLKGARYRATSDFSLNANPQTGQLFAFRTSTTAAPTWYQVGGTSIATPEAAGIVALANAQRRLAGKPLLSSSANAPAAVSLQQALYGRVAAGNTAMFSDIKTGANGTCNGCRAAAGYDMATGLGTPNIPAVVSALAAY